MFTNPCILQVNERAILIQINEKISPDVLCFLLNLKSNIIDNSIEVILEVKNTYNSLLIIYKYTISNFYNRKKALLQLFLSTSTSSMRQPELKKIPVCYEADFALDKDEISNETGLDFTEIISRHSRPIYTVYFIGFLPGFPYLGGMDSSLFCRRKSIPRPEIESGSVGIAGNQTGIYPSNSPGGWQIIGKTPISLFDLNNKNQPCLFSAGDSIQLEPISKDEYDYLLSHPEELKL